eukprot:PhM_4_TR3087/c0_g1_i1/m.53863
MSQHPTKDDRPPQLDFSSLLGVPTPGGFMIPQLSNTPHSGATTTTPDSVAHTPVDVTLIDISDVDFTNSRTLGSGTSGTVCTCRVVSKRLECVSKEVALSDDRRKEELTRELQTLQRTLTTNRPSLSKRNLVGFIGVAYSSNRSTAYILLERLDMNLESVLKAVKGGLPESFVRAVAHQVLTGLQFLHTAMHVVHRDVKPSNVVLRTSTGEVKVTDFGVSSRSSENDSQMETYVGCAKYMSPERLHCQNYTYPSDVWSLGIMLQEMLTGVHPLAHLEQGYWELRKSVTEQPPPVLSERDRSKVSPECCEFLQSCIRTDPKQRAKVAELLQHPFVANLTFETSSQRIRAFLEDIKRDLAARSPSAAEVRETQKQAMKALMTGF